MLTSLFDYHLPKNLIADSPATPRDHSRLMIIDRKSGEISHRKFYEIEKYLGPNDVLVLNKTKVFPARIFGRKAFRLRSGRLGGGGKVEILFIEEVKPKIWKCLTKPGLKANTIVTLQVFDLEAQTRRGHTFQGLGEEGETRLIKTDLDKKDLLKFLQKYGHTPLPPYIKSKSSEKSLRKTYQTVYAESTGSVAAPTAGFHFTPRLLKLLKRHGVQIEYVTLHVGLGTFLPVKTKKLEDHPMHYEYFEAEKEVVEKLNNAKKSGKRIIAVGTTTTRVLETLATENWKLETDNCKGSTNLFIYPPYKFKFVDALITNFHLPSSTLLALVSALVSCPNTKEEFKDFGSSSIGKGYIEAIEAKYRFYSFGDACFIV